MLKYDSKLLEKEKEIMSNKYTILENSFSESHNFSDKLLPKSKIYPLVKDSMWKSMINFERPEYVSYLLASLFNLDYDHVLENLKEVNFVLPKDNAKEAAKTVDFVCIVDNVIYILELNNQAKKYIFIKYQKGKRRWK